MFRDSPSSFPQFHRLPNELQDAIWQAAVQGVPPRVIELRDDYRGTEEEQRLIDEENHLYWFSGDPEPEANVNGPRGSLEDADPFFTSSCPIPALLHTCRRSREYALQRWTLCMSHLRHNDLDLYTDTKGFKAGQEEARVFFDFESDILLSSFVIIAPYCLKIEPEGLSRVRFVVVELVEFLRDIGSTEVGAASLTELIFWTLTDGEGEIFKSLVKFYIYRKDDREFGKGGPTLRLRDEPPMLETWVRTGLDGLKSFSEAHVPALTLPDIEFVNIGGDASVGGYC